MTEDFLHYLWQNQLFKEPLKTTKNELIKVINPGFHNLNAGPDFSNARLTIGSTLWAGNIEIHIRSSDWFRHRHQNDDAYRNVVLHVVFNDDVKDAQQTMPVCELGDKVDLQLFENYRQFINNNKFVPCAEIISSVAQEELLMWLERMLIEKIERRADFIQDALNASNNDWEEALYHVMARSFGFSINALPFEMLARSLSYKVLARYAGNLFQIEALLYGQAGMLTHDQTDIYGQDLFKEYSFLRKKHSLVPIDVSMWKYLRLRPVNFPTIRIAQFASLISNNAGILASLLTKNRIDEFIDLFDVTASTYWDNHFTFGSQNSDNKPKGFGVSSRNLLIINAVLPFMFVYGRSTGDEALCNKALNLYEQLSGEKNAVIDGWKKAGMKTSSAWQTQALLNLKSNYCDKKDCLHCRVGHLIMKDPQFTIRSGAMSNKFIKQ